jgi:hypothetical protein
MYTRPITSSSTIVPVGLRWTDKVTGFCAMICEEHVQKTGALAAGYKSVKL